MMRILGGLLVFTACAGGSLLRTLERAQALRRGEALLGSLRTLERELGRSAPETDALLRRAGAECPVFYPRLRRRLAEEPEAGLAALWREEAACLSLPERVREPFARAGGILGHYDAETQRTGLHECADTLREELRRVRETECRESSVRLALGSCAAVFLLALLW